MTTEEAIKFAVYAKSFTDIPEVKEFYALVEPALREQDKRRWIPVTEKLPDDGDSVIVVVSGKVESITLHDAIEFAEFSIDEGWILEMWPEWEDPNVTYWMSCPEPPKEDNDAKMQ